MCNSILWVGCMQSKAGIVWAGRWQSSCVKGQLVVCTNKTLCMEEAALKQEITAKLVESTKYLFLTSTIRAWLRRKSTPRIPNGTSATINFQEKTCPLNWSCTDLEP